MLCHKGKKTPGGSGLACATFNPHRKSRRGGFPFPSEGGPRSRKLRLDVRQPGPRFFRLACQFRFLLPRQRRKSTRFPAGGFQLFYCEFCSRQKGERTTQKKYQVRVIDKKKYRSVSLNTFSADTLTGPTCATTPAALAVSSVLWASTVYFLPVWPLHVQRSVLAPFFFWTYWKYCPMQSISKRVSAPKYTRTNKQFRDY